MAITLLDYVADTSNSGATLYTPSATLPGGAPNPGDLLICDIKSLEYHDAIVDLPDWEQLPNKWAGDSSIRLLYKVAQSGDGASYSFPWVDPGEKATTCRTTLSRWSGNWGSNPYDTATDSGIVFSATPTASITPASGASALIYAQSTYYNGLSATPGGGMTELDDGLGTFGTAPGGWCGYRIVDPAAGPYSVSCTWNNCCFQSDIIRAVSFIEGAPTLAHSQGIIIS